MKTARVTDDANNHDVHFIFPTNDSSLRPGWSPRLNANNVEQQLTPKSPGRKLSESRGVTLPDIKINPENVDLTGDKDNSIETPLPTASPLGRFNKPLFGGRHFIRMSEDKPNEIIQICIYLPDGKGLLFDVEGGRVATSKQLLDLVYEQKGLDASVAHDAFALWMCSPALEIQLKPHHMPFAIRVQWPEMLKRFTVDDDSLLSDEPVVVVRRNVYFDKRQQLQICHEPEIELLFLEARDFVRNGRYPCPLELCCQLVAMDMYLSWGPYKSTIHTPQHIRDTMEAFVPSSHIATSRGLSFFGWSVSWCNGLENQLLKQYAETSKAAPLPNEIKGEYLKLCMSLPVYGSAFFDGFVEHHSALSSSYLPVIIAINRAYICVFDSAKNTAIVTVMVERCNWRKVREPTENTLQLPSMFLHFSCKDDSDPNFSRVIQVFSKQVVMMDALLNSVAQIRISSSPKSTDCCDGISRTVVSAAEDYPWSNDPMYKTKLNKICAATFDAGGHCVEARGLLKSIVG